MFAPPVSRPHKKMSACRKGELAETLFVAGAMVHDWNVFLPIGHAQTADVCLVGTSGVLRVQVKTAQREQGKGDYRVNIGRGHEGKSAYTAGDFDVLAAYLVDRNQFVFWTLEDLNGRVRLRYSPDRHRAPGNWHLLDEVASSSNLGCRTVNVLPHEA